MRASLIEEVAFQLIKRASIVLPKDVKSSLQKAYEEETSKLGKTQLKAIIDNITIAERLNSPVCQDTGIVSFFIKGRSLDHKALEESLRRATIRATKEVPLRPNAVHPLTRKNSGDNTGLHIPGVTLMYEDADYVDITATLKGGGSENMSALYMIPPGEGIEGVKRVVLETIVNAGGQPCPPTVVNIGIGGTVDLTFKLAKMAMIRPLGVRHPEEEVARLEKELLELVNSTGIGPMGLGGRTTALDVKIEYAYCHTASLPVGINLQCWADRRATARIYPDGSWKILN
ncbi:MAG: fumarate hydratase [Candidatus Nezhaarchaeales archaeon]|nr:MAG: fumarate hydratase [Candidatus Nezhaarchaeota archaeon WYZ-LMO8]TDA37339.1 MAG: fumarate hydratase [Candidatus Nezhaarchaeota archaeon WYZ-LMO7]